LCAGCRGALVPWCARLQALTMELPQMLVPTGDGSTSAQGPYLASAQLARIYVGCDSIGGYTANATSVYTLVQTLLEQASRDYGRYKQLVEEHFVLLPADVRTQFYQEAHRVGTTTFAWSLLGPLNAREILALLFQKAGTGVSRLISVGAGTGYVEHLFLHAASGMGIPLRVYAFDSMEWLDSARPAAAGSIPPWDIRVHRGDYTVLRHIADGSWRATGANGMSDHGGNVGPSDLSDAVLLLCWPPFGSCTENQSTMAHDAARLFRELGGKYLVYIGDVQSTADWRFHEKLPIDWHLFEETHCFQPLDNWTPSKMGCIYAGCDSIGVYKCKSHYYYEGEALCQHPHVAPSPLVANADASGDVVAVQSSPRATEAAQPGHVYSCAPIKRS